MLTPHTEGGRSDGLRVTVQQVMQQAAALYDAGGYAEAERLCKIVLQVRPNNFDALRLIGIICVRTGRIAEAADFFRSAVEAEPADAGSHVNYGNILSELHGFDGALASYERAIALDPNYAEAHNNRGNALKKLGRFEMALQSYAHALELRPDLAQAEYNRGVILQEMKRFTDALASYSRVFRLRPTHIEALYNSGVALQELNQSEAALEQYEQVLRLDPAHAQAHNNRGVIQHSLQRFQAALDSYGQALKLSPEYAEALYNQGVTFQALKQFEAAEDSYERALRIQPNYAECHNNRGVVLKERELLESALDSYSLAIQIRPNYAEAHHNQGNALNKLGRYESAIKSYELAIKAKPDYAEAHNSLGNVFSTLRQFDAAFESYGKALRHRPDYAAAHNNLGIALQQLKRFEAARMSYQHAIKIDPDFADAHNCMGNLFQEIKQPFFALSSYERALELNPEYEWVYGMWLHTRMLVCRWEGFADTCAALADKIRSGKRAAPHFAVLALFDSPPLQLQAAKTWVAHKCPPSPHMPPLLKRNRGTKIRLGYYSADFHDHATAQLAAGLFEHHDRDLFELIAFSFGPNQQDAMRARLVAAFDEFVDVRASSDRQIAQLSRDLQIDVAVDLKGFTQDQRAGIFAHRAASIQVNYLGYPATMGAPYMDYLIADHTLIPPQHRQHYMEKIAYLPHSYQVNDRKRQISAMSFTRSQCGLPASGFVFCCFNNVCKITPFTFDCWMRIVRQVDDSVLWLLEDNPDAAQQLRREAQARGIDPQRLIFAQRLPLAEHLARLQVADLFLDTTPYNAHTSASDALWVGLPILTRLGDSFAARVAASLLNAIDLPEMITHTLEQYETLAIRCATDAALLASLRKRLDANRLSTPLFDTAAYSTHLEAAYVQMYERYHAGLGPEHIMVGATPAQRHASAG